MLNRKNSYFILLVLLISTSPMYWFVGISLTQFTIIKTALLVLLIVVCFVTNDYLMIKFRYIEILPVLFMMASVVYSYLYVGDLSLDKFILDIYPYIFFLILATIFKCYFINTKGLTDITNLFHYISIFILILCLIILSSVIFNFNIHLQGSEYPFTFTGFAVLRTTWSGSLSLYIGAIVYMMVRKQIEPNLFYIMFFVVVIATQYLSGGRGGLLSSVILILICLYSFDKLKYLLLLLVLLLPFFYHDNFVDSFMDHLRLDRAEKGGDISAGRLRQYSEAINLTLNNYFFPLGTRGYMDYFRSIGLMNPIHNVFLNFLVQYGLIFFASFITYLSLIFKFQKKAFLSCIIVLAMLIPTLFEPSAIFNNFNAYIMWWFIFNVHIYYNEF